MFPWLQKKKTFNQIKIAIQFFTRVEVYFYPQILFINVTTIQSNPIQTFILYFYSKMIKWKKGDDCFILNCEFAMKFRYC